MPSTPYAKILVSVDGGALTSGGLTVAAGASIHLQAESTVGWSGTPAPKWEIYEYPAGWSAPAGWSTDAQTGAFYFLGVSPPDFDLPDISLWGKFLLLLTVDGKLVDDATGLSVLSTQGFTDVAFGESNQFDARRQYIGSLKSSLRLFDQAATTAANATSGATRSPVKAAATANVTRSGTQTLDGVACGVGDRVLLAFQTDASTNGIYVVASGAWTRSADANTSALVVGSMAVAVQLGATNRSKIFILVTQPPITLGSTPLKFIPQTPSIDARVIAAANDSTDDLGNLQAAATASPEVVYTGPTDYKIVTSGGTIGTAASLHNFSQDSGRIHVPASTTVTLRGQVLGYRQIFHLDDPDTSVVLLPDMGRVRAQWYGAVGDANFFNSGDGKWYVDSGHTIEATDNSGPIHAAINSMRANGGGEVLVPRGVVGAKSPIVFGKTTDPPKNQAITNVCEGVVLRSESTVMTNSVGVSKVLATARFAAGRALLEMPNANKCKVVGVAFDGNDNADLTVNPHAPTPGASTGWQNVFEDCSFRNGRIEDVMSGSPLVEVTVSGDTITINNGGTHALPVGTEVYWRLILDCWSLPTVTGTTLDVSSDGADLSSAGTLNVASAAAMPPAGAFYITSTNGRQRVEYTGKTGTTLTGCTGGTGIVHTGAAIAFVVADDSFFVQQVTGTTFKLSTTASGLSIASTSTVVTWSTTGSGRLLLALFDIGDNSQCSFENCMFGNRTAGAGTRGTLQRFGQRGANTYETELKHCWFQGPINSAEGVFTVTNAGTGACTTTLEIYDPTVGGGLRHPGNGDLAFVWLETIGGSNALPTNLFSDTPYTVTASDNAGAFKLESTTGAGAVTFGSSGVGTLKVLFIPPPFHHVCPDEGTITMIGCTTTGGLTRMYSRGRPLCSVGSQGVAVYDFGGTSQDWRALDYDCTDTSSAPQIGGISMNINHQHIWPLGGKYDAVRYRARFGMRLELAGSYWGNLKIFEIGHASEALRSGVVLHDPLLTSLSGWSPAVVGSDGTTATAPKFVEGLYRTSGDTAITAASRRVVGQPVVWSDGVTDWGALDASGGQARVRSLSGPLLLHGANTLVQIPATDVLDVAAIQCVAGNIQIVVSGTQSFYGSTFQYIGNTHNFFDSGSRLALTETLIGNSVSTFQFGAGVTGITFDQADNTTNGATGAAWIDQAQNCTGTGSTVGGKRSVRSGTGAQAGTTEMCTGNTPIIQCAEPQAGNPVVVLCRGSDITSTQMPAGTGKNVMYWADRITAPTANPVSGCVPYSENGYPWVMPITGGPNKFALGDGATEIANDPNATATLANSNLTVPIAANEVRSVVITAEIVLDGTGSISFALAGPGGSAAKIRYCYYNAAAANAAGFVAISTRKDLTPGGGAGAISLLEVVATVTNGATPGNVVLQFAEFVHGAGVIINAGASITDRRIK